METKRTATRIPLSDIVALYKSGLTPPDISLCTGVKLRTVQRWVKRYKDHGGEDISDIRVYCGRKRVCLSEVLEEIQRQLLSNPRATARQLQNSNPDILGGLSLRTIQRWIREDMGLMRKAGWKWKTFDDIGTPKMNVKGSKPKPSATSLLTVPEEELTPQRQLQQLAHDDQDDELFDDDLEVEIKEEVLDDEMPEVLEAYHIEPTVETKRDPDMIIPDPRPSTSYISVTPLHKVLPTIDESISPNTRLADMDEFHLFGMNVASQLRALPLHDALQAQLEMQTILTKKRSNRLS